jgi:dodecin
MAVYKVIEVIGTSETSWEDAASQAVIRAGQTVDDLRIAEVVSQDLKIENGKVTAYRTKLSLSFKFRE